MNSRLRVCASMAGIGFACSLINVAQAIPAGQAKCSFTGQTSVAPEPLKQLSTLSVTVNNGTSPRRAIVQLAADICVEPVAEIRVGYSVDGGAPGVFGPTNLANHQEFCETRSTIAVVPLPAGIHTIRPFWRVSGANGKVGTFIQGCVTAESATR